MAYGRRKFLQQASATTLGLGFAPNTLSSQSEPISFQEKSPLDYIDFIDIKNESYQKVVIVGSGYGSAVTAFRLAEVGISSVILEMGKVWSKKGKDGKVYANAIAGDERSMWLDNKTSSPIKYLYGIPAEQKVPMSTGIIHAMRFDGIDACMARGFGGGSLVNMAMMIRAKNTNIQRFLPTEDLHRFFSYYYPLAEKMLEVNTIDLNFFNQTEYYNYSRIAQNHFKKATFSPVFVPSGYDFTYMEMEARDAVPKSALGFEIGYGNNFGKKSLDKTYLAKAFATKKVQLSTMTQIKYIECLDNGNYSIDYLLRDESTGAIVYNGKIECTYLFLGAGSLGTTEILLRSKSKGTLPRLPDEVGSNWGNNSEAFVAQNNSWREPSGVRQSGVPVGASMAEDQDHEDMFVMHLPLPSPLPTWVSWHAIMTSADAHTKILFDNSKDSIHIPWSTEQSDPIERKAKFVFDLVNAKNEIKYNTSLFDNQKPFSTKSAYHLLGGCMINKATNEYGELKNYQNLFITDGSLLPNHIGVNPALTIAALAERNIDFTKWKLIREMELV